MDERELVDFCLKLAAVGRNIEGEIGEKMLDIAKKHLYEFARGHLFPSISGVDTSGTS